MNDTNTKHAAAQMRRLSPTAQEILAEQQNLRPIWIRAPKTGPERYTGLTRPKLYQLAEAGRIKTASLREPGQIKGVRVFNLASILAYIEANVITAESGMVSPTPRQTTVNPQTMEETPVCT